MLRNNAYFLSLKLKHINWRFVLPALEFQAERQWRPFSVGEFEQPKHDIYHLRLCSKMSFRNKTPHSEVESIVGLGNLVIQLN